LSFLVIFIDALQQFFFFGAQLLLCKGEKGGNGKEKSEKKSVSWKGN